MPTILFLFGLRFFFYSEEHLPIHIHVQSGDGRAKIDVITGEILDNKGVKPKDLKRAVETVQLYQDEIIKAWREYFDE
ncbi:MAG: DUF4160 domain-containing protein [Bacteroidales bacterium]|jgi:limonene-1,2-epoxide hydrolase|nr:DUF4160 domain-containing protein [Bacteroidales bacterium]MBQ5410878.1 DUF4160 domain-containing protein [Bacteroidales bacterium]MBQ5487041.1 DUF4160 domain-containing protein [Bacteroidales bacterium]MCR5132799.1 DUF4160 domain-containing protein [Bacteroidales bacterium]